MENESFGLPDRDYNRELEQDIECEHAHYVNEADILKQESEEKYHQDILEISRAYKDESSSILQEGKNMCIKMAKEQRGEAKKLEDDWREARNRQIKREKDDRESKIATAKFLAKHDCIETARIIKVPAKTSSSRSKEVAQIDALFQKQYELMIQRHERDFAVLHDNVKAKIIDFKKEAEFQKKLADANRDMSNSQIPAIIISSVALQRVHEEAKKRVIQTFSPRKQKNNH